MPWIALPCSLPTLLESRWRAPEEEEEAEEEEEVVRGPGEINLAKTLL